MSCGGLCPRPGVFPLAEAWRGRRRKVGSSSPAASAVHWVLRLRRGARGLKRGKSLYKGGGLNGVRGPCPSELGGGRGKDVRVLRDVAGK